MKHAEPQDPLELVGVGLPGGCMDDMATCIVEEYLMLGCSEEQILALFRRPCFGATHRIYRLKGENHVRAIVSDVRRRFAVAYQAEGSGPHE